MTKKDFELIARVLRQVDEERDITPMDADAALANVRIGLAVAFSLNPRFDRERFIAAATRED